MASSNRLITAALLALLAASPVAGQTLTADADSSTPGAQSGSVNWHGTNAWWNGSSSQIWVDGSDAVIPSGTTVTASQAAETGALQIDGALTIRSTEITVGGQTTGSGRVSMDFGGRDATGRGLSVTSTTTVPWTIRGSSTHGKTLTVAARGENAYVTFDGFWELTGGGNRAYAIAFEGATFRFGPNARVNNQIAGDANWNAREFNLYSDGTGTFDFDANFDADLGGTQENPIGGLSVYRIFNASIITRGTDGLPAIWKGAAGSVKHHGGMKFIENDEGLTWTVDSAAQNWDGGAAWRVSWTLNTLTDLTHTTEGRFETNLDDGWGPDWGVNENAIVTKTGPATLTLAGDHAYTPGSGYVIEEGTIRMLTDPTYVGDHPNPNANVGQFLSVIVENSGALEMHPDAAETWGLESLSLAAGGQAHLAGGRLSLTGSLTSAGSSTLMLQPAISALSATEPYLEAGSMVILAEAPTLVIDPSNLPGDGDYLLLRGSVGSILPMGTLSVVDTTLQPYAFGAEIVEGSSDGEFLLRIGSPSQGSAWSTWQALYFSEDLIAQGAAEPTGDFDNDGLPNLIEYAIGEDPTTPATERYFYLDLENDRLVLPALAPNTSTRLSVAESSGRLFGPPFFGQFGYSFGAETLGGVWRNERGDALASGDAPGSAVIPLEGRDQRFFILSVFDSSIPSADSTALVDEIRIQVAPQPER